MKFICLGYLDEKKWAELPKEVQDSMMEEFYAYSDELRNNGHFIGGESLESAHTAVTLRYRDSRILVTDGPFAETKEQVGGIFVLEAVDINHAIELMSKHPGLRLGGPFEIRPANAEFDAEVEARRKRIKRKEKT